MFSFRVYSALAGACEYSIRQKVAKCNGGRYGLVSPEMSMEELFKSDKEMEKKGGTGRKENAGCIGAFRDKG